jgi:hypothetical protein
MSYRYLATGKRQLIQYLACNLLPKGYVFYTTFMIPKDKDAELIDAKLITKYNTWMHKQKAYRLHKGGQAIVKYVRLGNLGVLLATRGESAFFKDETGYKDARDYPIVLFGYSISINRETGKVSVRLHRETQRRLKKFLMTWGNRRSREWWEAWIRKFPFSSYAGVRDNLFSLIRFLNDNRKSFKQLPVEWKRCVRKKIKPVVCLRESSPELLQLLQWCYSQEAAAKRKRAIPARNS